MIKLNHEVKKVVTYIGLLNYKLPKILKSASNVISFHPSIHLHWGAGARPSCHWAKRCNIKQRLLLGQTNAGGKPDPDMMSVKEKLCLVAV